MKKRVIISIILTIICIIFTSNFWLSVNPFEVSFNVKGKGTAEFKVVLNKKYDDKFIKIRSSSQIINMDKDNKIDIFIKRIRVLKKLKLIIIQDKLNNIELSNIKLAGKNELKNFQDFSAENAELRISGKNLIIVPNRLNSTIICNKKLNILTDIKIDFKIFIIILILSFLLFNKLVSYLADFKTIKNYSKIDILFLVACLVILYLPVTNISKNDVSKRENRMLAKYQKLVKDDKKVNYNFGKDFDYWFSDRFFLRDAYIDLYDYTHFCFARKMYNKNTFYINKKTKWAFDTHFIHSKSVERNELNKIILNLEKLDKFTKSQNIKLYIMLAPTKGCIYPEAILPFKAKCEAGYEYKEAINKKLGYNLVIYPLDEMKKASANNYVMAKNDVHWTEHGAFIAYQELIKNIENYFNDAVNLDDKNIEINKNKLVRTDDRFYHNGNIYQALHLNSRYLDTEYLTYKFTNEHNIQKFYNDIYRSEDTYFDKGYNKSVYMIGDSYSESLLLFIENTFKEVHKKRINNKIESIDFNMNKWEKDILKSKPDILLITTHLNNFILLNTLYGDN